MNHSVNVSTSDLIVTSEWTPGQVFFLLFIVALMTVTLLGNGLVIASWFVDKTIQTPSNSLLVSLALTDFLIGAFIMPIRFAKDLPPSANLMSYMGSFSCSSYILARHLLFFMSANHLVLIAVDRYRIVFEGVSYLQRRTLRGAIQSVALLWIFAVLIMSPIYFDSEGIGFMALKGGVWNCGTTTTTDRKILRGLWLILLPFLSVVIVYAKIFIELRIRFKPAARGDVEVASKNTSLELMEEPLEGNIEDTSESRKGGLVEDVQSRKNQLAMEKERRAAITLGILIVALIVCWTPYFVVSTILWISGVKHPKILGEFAFALGFVNSAVNPVVYSVRNQDFQRAFKTIAAKVLGIFKCH